MMLMHTYATHTVCANRSHCLLPRQMEEGKAELSSNAMRERLRLCHSVCAHQTALLAVHRLQVMMKTCPVLHCLFEAQSSA